jgi:hypothetical protein
MHIRWVLAMTFIQAWLIATTFMAARSTVPGFNYLAELDRALRSVSVNR